MQVNKQTLCKKLPKEKISTHVWLSPDYQTLKSTQMDKLSVHSNSL